MLLVLGVGAYVGMPTVLQPVERVAKVFGACLLYTSDAADERSSVDLGGRRIIKKKTNIREQRKPRATKQKTEDNEHNIQHIEQQHRKKVV